MTRSEKSKKKRDEIVNRVISMLSRINFNEATVRNICASAHISIGTFYHYFPEKNDLILEILHRIDRYLEEQVLPSLTAGDELENMMRFGEGFAEYTSSVGNATGGIISSGDIPLPAGEEEMRKERLRPLYAIPIQILTRGKEKGQILPSLDVDEAVDQLIISLRGQSLEWSRRGRRYDIKRKIASFMSLYIRAIKA